MLIDAILEDGGDSNGPEGERTYTPPPGWRASDVSPQQENSTQDSREGTSNDSKTYTEEQRQGVLRYQHKALLYAD